MNIAPWRDASRPLRLFGVPALLYGVYLLWFHWPSMDTLYACTALLLFFKVLDMLGYTLAVLAQRLVHLLRGNPVTGRP